MFSNKIDLPYCLVVFFVVCLSLRPFWSVFGELACFWCSTAKIKTRQHRDFRSNQECPSLEANNSAGITPDLNFSTHSKQRCCSSMSIHSIRNTSHRSLAMLLSLARSASELVSFGVVLMSCRVNFHVVRSALQYSACLNLSNFSFLLIRSLKILRSPEYSFAVLCSPLWLMFVLGFWSYCRKATIQNI